MLFRIYIAEQIMELLDGKLCAKNLRTKLKNQLKNAGESRPALAIVIVGDDPASKVYVRNKNRAAKEIGITTYNYMLNQDTDLETLLSLIHMLNNNDKIDGILVQMPLPEQFTFSDVSQVIEAIDPAKDVDGFHPTNLGNLFIGNTANNAGMQYPVPCTPKGIMYLLKENNIPIDGKNAVVIGRSTIVGKPMAALLTNNNATVTLAHSHTQHLADITRKADIIIVAVGKADFLTADMVKPDTVIIDVGMNRKDGKLVGDVDFDSFKGHTGYITPVPGGVGPMTVAMLFEQLIMLHQNKVNKA